MRPRIAVRSGLALAFVLTLSACVPSPVQEPVRSTAAPPAFPMLEYERMAQRGVHVFVVDAGASRVLIEVRRAGPLARLGHDHSLVAHVHGYIAPQEQRADLYVRLDTLAVDEPDARREAGFDTQPSAADIAGTRQNMLTKVLDARFAFVQVRIAGAQTPGVPTKAVVALNGSERVVPVAVERKEDAKRFVATGELSIRQSDFGIAPFSILGGAIQVADRIDVRFTIDARLLEPSTARHEETRDAIQSMR